MSSFSWKKDIEDSIKDAVIVTVTTTRIIFAIKAANLKPPKASLGAVDIIEHAGGMCGWVLVND